MAWTARGPGGGGAMYAPAISPFNHQVLFTGSDMNDSFRSDDGGLHWVTHNFLTQMQGYKNTSGVQFTSDSNVMYCASGSRKTVNGGKTWAVMPGAGGTWGLFADGNGTNRVIESSYDNLYYSSNGGNTFSQIYTGVAMNVGGAYFNGPQIFIGTSSGLLVSVNNGTNFTLSGISGIPANQYIATFAGGTGGGTTRLFCVTFDNFSDGMFGWCSQHYMGVYRLDYGTGTWVMVTNGINRAGGDQPVYVAMATNDIQTVYLGGSESQGAPLVMLSTNGGNSWAQVFKTAHNANIATGWEGDDFSGNWNWADWGWDQFVLGLGVSPGDSRYAVITGLGFLHITTNSGASWTQAYDVTADQNPTNSPTIRNKSYQGNGLEDTSCWWLQWMSSNELFACFTDIHGMLSTNGGVSWMSPSTLSYNSTYKAARNPANGYVYAAASSVHDIYVNYMSDGRIDGGTGEALYSSDKGRTWQRLHNFTKPTIDLCLDSVNTNRMYAAVVNYGNSLGGIYVTSNINLAASSTWTKLAAPPRTEGHPLDIVALNDGTLVCTYSARTDSNGYRASSGVFVSTNGGSSWVDRSLTNMYYFTKHLTVDPHDPGQNTWYVGVFNTLYWNDQNTGLYRTTNRGVSWSNLTARADFPVESCTVDPSDSNTVYLATGANGLWYTTNAFAATPLFLQATNYPFCFPTRVYFNPYNANETWTTSFGNGMKSGLLGASSGTTCTLTTTLAGTGAGSIGLNPSGGVYAQGTVVALTATADPDSTFGGWSGALSGAQNPASLTMDADHAVTATFTRKTNTITATAGAHGSIAPSGAVSVVYGGLQTFMLAPDNGYEIASVVVDGGSMGVAGTYTFTNVIAGHTLAVSFQQLTNSPAITSPSAATGTVGAVFSYVITADHNPTGFAVSGLPAGLTLDAANGTISGTPAAGGMTNVTILATNAFGADACTLTLVVNSTITATAGATGSIAPSGSVWVSGGASQAFTITPGVWYAIAGVQVDGVSAGVVSSYGFTNVTTNHTIAASFVALLAPLGTPLWWLARHGYTNNELALDPNGVPVWKDYLTVTDPNTPGSGASYNIVPYAEGFENLAGWGGGYTNVINAMGWSGVPGMALSQIINLPYTYTATNLPLPALSHTNVLLVNEQGTILTNSFGPGFDMSNAVVYLDLMAQFVPIPGVPATLTATDSGRKGSLYANSNLQLTVYHGVAAQNGSLLSNTCDATSRLLPSGTWHRVTWAIDATSTNPANALAMFQLRLDGLLVTHPNAYDDTWKVQFQRFGTLPATSATGTWFRLATTNAVAKLLTALCCFGMGYLDDVAITTNNPFGVVSGPYLLIVSSSGNGSSSLGAGPYVAVTLAAGASTQIVYTAADWNRISTLASNGVSLIDAVSAQSYTQTVLGLNADLSNAVAFALATPVQTGYTNVPTAWLTNWTQGSVQAAAGLDSFSLHDKYVLGLDPTSSNSYTLVIEGCAPAGSNIVVRLRRDVTGALANGGMNGYLILQAANSLTSAFTNLPAVILTGNDAFDDTGHRNYTNAVDNPRKFYKAVVQ